MSEETKKYSEMSTSEFVEKLHDTIHGGATMLDTIRLLNEWEKELQKRESLKLPSPEEIFDAGVDEGMSRSGSFEWGIHRVGVKFSEWLKEDIEYRK